MASRRFLWWELGCLRLWSLTDRWTRLNWRPDVEGASHTVTTTLTKSWEVWYDWWWLDCCHPWIVVGAGTPYPCWNLVWEEGVAEAVVEEEWTWTPENGYHPHCRKFLP